jgi:dTDP-glucose 4,6-dehydratase
MNIVSNMNIAGNMNISDNSKCVLVTGGCGFIASNVIHLLLKNGYIVVNLDKMYDNCANSKNISQRYNFETKRIDKINLAKYFFYEGDICNSELVLQILNTHNVQLVYHFAAQTHVDNSFKNAHQFVQDNILGTTILLECCRKYNDDTHKLEKFIHVSTDEVYGDMKYNEHLININGYYNPTNPYAATKAGAELMVKSYQISYNLPIIITRSNNVYGPHQYWEKIIPKFINLLTQNKKVPIYGDGSAKRKYLYIEDACDAYLTILENGLIGQIYEMGSHTEYSAKEMAYILIGHVKKICINTDNTDEIDKWINYVEDRKFHDSRYLVNPDNLRKLGWIPHTSFGKGLSKTIEWYVNYAIPNSYWEN